MERLGNDVLAAYYNEARLNIILCLDDIREKMGLPQLKDDAQVQEAFKTLSISDMEKDRFQYLDKLLKRRFPFAIVLAEAELRAEKNKKIKAKSATLLPEHYDSALKWIFGLIHNLRNVMVHPECGDLMIDYNLHKKIFFGLSHSGMYDSSLNTIKNRYDLKGAVVDELVHRKEKGLHKVFDGFSLAICTEPGSRKNKVEVKQSEVLHNFGHILLCSLFLDKTQSAELLSYFWETKGANQWDSSQQKIIREILSTYRIKLPLQRLSSDDTPTAVTMDTLKELSSCPRSLFDSLDKSKQALFRSGPSLTKETSQVEEDDDDITLLTGRRGRQNRFIPLMMRFLDFNSTSIHSQKKIRFAIDLGHFYFNVRYKPARCYSDKVARMRRLGKKIVSYGQITDLENLEQPKQWQTLVENYQHTAAEQAQAQAKKTDEIQKLSPYIVPYHPRYHYYDDKIGFRLLDNGNTTAYPGLYNDANQAIKKEEMMPHFWMSPAQLNHLAFYTYLNKTQTSALSLDLILLKYRLGMEKLVKAISDGETVTGLEADDTRERKRETVQNWLNTIFDNKQGQLFSVSLADLPKVLVNYLFGSAKRSIPVEKIRQRIEGHLIKETENKEKELEDLLKGYKSRGKKGFRALHSGRIGDFLADDLMRFQPVDQNKEDGGKLNSQNYQRLQAELAYWGWKDKKTSTVIDLLKDAGLLDGEYAHPFLGKLKLEGAFGRYPDLVSFYKAYLKERKNYLKRCLAEYQGKATVDNVPRWLRMRQVSQLENWLNDNVKDVAITKSNKTVSKKEFKQPLTIPKNMLYQPILSMLAQELGISKEKLEKEGTKQYTRNRNGTAGTVAVRPAISWLIKRYIKHKGDDVQEMYRYERSHQLFNEYLDKRNMQSKEQYNPKKSIPLKEEKRAALLTEIRDFIKKTTDEKKKEKFKKLLSMYKHREKVIRHTSTEDILLYLFASDYLTKLQLSNTAHVSGWTLKDIHNELLNTSFKVEIPIPDKKLTKRLSHPECKIKDLGKLKLLVRDNRLPTLLPYYPDDAVNQSIVREELRHYAKVRVKVMKKVHQLEKQIVKNKKRFAASVINSLGTEPGPAEKAFGNGRHGADLLFGLYTYFQQEYTRTPFDLANYQDAFDDKKFNKALKIRNAFSHNQYPSGQEFDCIKQKVSANPQKIADHFLQELNSLYQPWLDYLDQIKRTH